MYKNFIRQNATFVAIILFVFCFGIIQIFKPNCLYNKDGSLREFGVGYKNKTILPMWLLSLLLGIVSYLGVMYYIANPKLF